MMDTQCSRPRRGGRLASALAIAVLWGAAPVSAQDGFGPAEAASFALDVCIRATSEASVNAETGKFLIRGRQGDTATYAHPAGPRLALTIRPGFFGCELTISETAPAYLETLVSELGPAMQQRFQTEGETVDGATVWDVTTPEGYAVTTQVARSEQGTVTLTSNTSMASQPPSQ